MKPVYRILLLWIALFLPSLLLASVVIATVDETNITQDQVDAFVQKSLPGANYAFMNAAQKQQVIDQLIDRQLYLTVAEKEKIDRDQDYLIALEKAKENLMLDIWMKKRLETIRVDESEMQRYYQEHRTKYKQSAAASARHILVGSEAEAVGIIQELQGSANMEAKFIELARAKSTGPSSVNGGDLGWFNEDQMVPEFSQAALALQKGDITTIPVKTHFGYHVIFLCDKRPAGVVPYEKVKENISQTIKLQKFKENLKSLSQNLRKSAKITVK